MRPPKTHSQSSIISAVLAGVLISMPYSFGQAQTSNQDECQAKECFSPEFDVGIVYQSPVGHYGITELMYAVETNDLAKVEELLASRADVDARNDGGATALLMAAAYGSREIVDSLLAARADPDIASHRGDTPLASAIQYSHADIAVALLKHGANPDVYNSPDDPRFRKNVLVRAAVLGQTQVVELLLELGADVQESGLEALSLALWKHHEDVAALLLETGIDLNVPTYDTTEHTYMQTGEFVLQTAAQQGLLLSTAMLLEKGADVNRRDVHGNSALYFAVRGNHAEILRLLLDTGADVVGNDIAAALDAGNESIVRQLAVHLDVDTLGIGEMDTLIVKADQANDTELLDRLFSARESLSKTQAVTTLLFAKAGADDCELVRWDLASGRQVTIFSSPGQCEQGFFFSRPRSELYVLEGHDVSVISLDTPEAAAKSIRLPTAMIDENLAALKERLSIAFGGHDISWLSARVVQVGVLDSGELAFVTHSSGPADGTYGYLYAMDKDAWRLVRHENCHRFDPCRFDEVLGHSLHERSNDMTVWSPEIRRNPYFVGKTETAATDYEYVSWDGVVTMNIDGQQSLLHYGKGESGHCAEDCVFTSGLSLELPGQGTIKIANIGGNNAIVDRYALVWTQRRSRSELIDLGTGESVFGELQVAGWVH